MHKLSAWQRGKSHKERDAATAPDPAAEERRRQLLETLLGAFCERALSDRELETLQAFYVDEVNRSAAARPSFARCVCVL